MALGLGAAINLGSAIAYLHVDASGMRRGLLQAERAMTKFKRSQDATRDALRKSAAADMSRNMASGGLTAATSAAMVRLENRVAAAADAATARIRKSYDDRGKAIRENARIADREMKKIVKLEADLAKATSERDKLKTRKADIKTKLSYTDSRMVTGSARDKLKDELKELSGAGNKIAALNKEIAASAKQIRVHRKAISDAAAAASASVVAANRRELLSINALEGQLKKQSQAYRALAANAGPQYEKLAEAAERTGRRLVDSMRAVAQAERAVEEARRRRASAVGSREVEAATKGLESAVKRRDKLQKDLDTAREKHIRSERNFTNEFGKEAGRRIKIAEDEAIRVEKARQRESDASDQVAGVAAARGIGAAQSAAIAMATVIGVASNAWIGYEQQLYNVLSISGDAETSIDNMKESIDELSVSLGKAPEDLAAGLYSIAQAGITGAPALEVLRVAAESAVAGMTDVETAARPIIGVMNAFGVEAEKASDISDVLFASVTRGIFSFEDLSSQLGDNLSNAAALNVTLEELASAYVVLTRRSNSLAESTTQVNAVINSFMKPSEELEQAFQDLTGESATLYFRTHDLGEVLNTVSRLFQENADAAGRLFPNLRAIRGIFGLTADEAEDFALEMEFMKNSAIGMREAVLNVQMQAVAFQLSQAKEEARQAAIALGMELAPAIVFMSKAVSAASGPLATFLGSMGGIPGIAVGISGGFLIAAASVARFIGFLGDGIAGIRRLKEEMYLLYLRTMMNAKAMAVLRVVLNPYAAAIAAVAAAVGYAFYQWHKHRQELKKVDQSYKDLAQTIADLQTSSLFTAEESDKIAAYDDRIKLLQQRAQELSDLWHKEGFAGDQFVEAVPAIDEAGRALEEQVFTIDEWQAKIAAILKDEDFDEINADIAEILKTPDLRFESLDEAFNQLLDSYYRGAITGDQLVQGFDDLRTGANKLTNAFYEESQALTTVGKALVNVDQFFGTLETTADSTRKAMQGFVQAFYEANGVMLDFTDPLSTVNSLLGTMGEDAITTIARLGKLGEIQLTPEETIGVNLIAQMENAKERIDDVNESIQESQQRMADWQGIISLVSDTVGTSANEYEQLVFIAERFGLAQDEVNDIQKAAIYLNEQAKIGIAEEQLATARALPDLAQYVAQHERLREEYFALDDGARGAAEALKDQNTQMLIFLAVLMKLLDVMQPGVWPEEFTTKFYADISAADAGTAKLLERWDLLPEDFTTTVAVDVDPSLDTLDELDKAIADAQAGLDYMQASGYGQFNEELKKRQQEVIDALTKRRHDIELGVVTPQDSALPEILSGIEDAAELGEEAVDKLEEAWTDAFDSMERSTTDLSLELAQAIPDLYRTAAALEDFSDPLAVMTKRFHTVEDSIEDVLLKGEALSDLDYGFDQAQRAALVLNRNFKEVERRIAAVNDEIANNQDDMSMWEGYISLIDETVGDTTDTMSQYRQALHDGRITQEEFDDAVASGDAHFAFEELNQLLNTGRITQKEYNDIVKYSIWLRERSVGGVLDERAEIAKSIPALARYIAHHDDLDGKMKELTDTQRGFIAAVNEESVQTALATTLMLKELEAQGIAAEGSAEKYLRAAAAANPALAAVVADMELLEGDHTVTIDIVLSAQAQATITELDAQIALWESQGAQAKVALQADPGNASALQQLLLANGQVEKLQRAKAIVYIEAQIGQSYENLKGIENVILRINDQGQLEISGDDADVQIVLEQLEQQGIDPKTVKIVPELEGTAQEAVDAALVGQDTPTIEADVTASGASVDASGTALDVGDQEVKVTADVSAALVTMDSFSADMLIRFQNLVVMAQDYGTFAGESYGFALADALDSNLGDMEVALLDGPGRMLRTSADLFSDYGGFAGVSFDYGIAKGMLSSVGIAAIDRAARYTALRAYFSAMAALQSRSPSKKGMFAGQTFTQGFALGIISEEDAAIAAAERVARNTSAAMSGAIDTGFDRRALSAGRALPVGRGNVAPMSGAYAPTTNTTSTVLDLDVHVNGAGNPQETAKAVTDEVWQMLHQGFVTMDARTRK